MVPRIAGTVLALVCVIFTQRGLADAADNISTSTPTMDTTDTPPGTSISTDIEAKHLTKTRYCLGQTLRDSERYREMGVRSRLQCVSQCGMDADCVSLVYDEQRRLCGLGRARALENCTNMQPAEPAAVFYQTPHVCVEGEVMNPLGLCECARGYTGVPCTRYFHDCSDQYYYGDWHGDDVYSVQPLSSRRSFKVYCRFITNVRLHVTIRKKNKNQEDFNRPWADYKDGFGNLKSDSWIGLEKLHALTSADRSYKLRWSVRLENTSTYAFVYTDFKDVAGCLLPLQNNMILRPQGPIWGLLHTIVIFPRRITSRLATAVPFNAAKVSDEASGYRLFFNASEHKDPAGCFLPLGGAAFSAYDHDQDEAPDVNCALVRKGGFWYRGSSCAACSPHGVLYKEKDGLLTGKADESFWAQLGQAAPYKITAYLMPADAIDDFTDDFDD